MNKINNPAIKSIIIYNTKTKNSENLIDLFSTVNVYESIYDNYVTGNITLTDGVSLLEKFPLRGDEKIYIEFSGTEKDEMDVYVKEFDVINISNIDNTNGKALKFYTIFLHTPIAELNRQNNLRIGVEDTESNIVINIVTTTLKQKEVSIEETKNTKKYIFPSWRPLAAINQLAKTAQRSGGLDSSSFLFFENKDGFNFHSLESMVSDTSPYPEFHEKMPLSPTDIDFYAFSGFQCDHYFDSEESGEMGAYGSVSHEVDMLNKTVTMSEHQYGDLFEAWPKIDPKAKSVKLNDIDKPKRKVFQTYKTDEQEDRGYQHASRAFALGLFENFICTGTILLNTNITAGTTANLALDTQSIIDPDRPHAVLSGKHLITSVRHEFTSDRGITTIEFRKPTTRESV